ncbi:MAG: protein phosphatase 2C family protein [Patescibacteria group bacterium]|nr:protein phosphatase 2C family protein [Patescibacteria group bacterium]
MKKKLVFRTAKLLSDSRKLKSDSGVSIAYEHQPKEIDEQNHGSLFVVIELSGPVASSQEISELIIDTLHSEYYRDLDRDPLESFEAALSKINEELTDITEQGKIHWLGRLNAVLAVISDHTLHLTQAGNAEAYLFRKNQMSHITSDLAGDNVNPLRTFINIASGEIQEDDKIGFFSPSVFYHLSKEELQKYATEFHPNIAVSHIASLLDEMGSQRKFSALIIEMLTPEALANDTIEEAPDEVWITESKSGIEAVTEGTSSVILKAATKSLNFLRRFRDFVKVSVIPFVLGLTGSVVNFGRSIFSLSKRRRRKNVLIEPKEAIATERFTEELPEEMSGYDTDNTQLTEKPERTSLVYSTLNNFAGGFKKTSQAVKFPKNRNYRLIIISSLVAVIVLVTAYSIFNKIKANRYNSAKVSLETAVSKFRDGENLLILNEKEKAIISFEESKNLTLKVKESGLFTKESDDLLARIKDKVDQASGIVAFTGEAFSDFNGLQATGLLGIQKIGDNFYFINSNTGAVYAANIKTSEEVEVVKNFEFSGKPVAAVAVEDTKKAVILTDTPALYEFDLETKEIYKLKMSDPLEKGIALASFGSNIYVLSRDDSTVYKHIKVVGSYSKKNNYIVKATNSNAGNGSSIAIDGNVYILSNDGIITKFASGIQQPCEVKGLPQKPGEGSILYASPDIKGMYILDKSRNSVIVIDEVFNFVKQIRSDNFSDLKGIYVGTDNIIYVLSGAKLYKIEG